MCCKKEISQKDQEKFKVILIYIFPKGKGDSDLQYFYEKKYKWKVF